MKNIFTRINNVRLQASQKTGQLSQMYFSLKDRVKVFSQTENSLENKFKFEKEFIIDDEVLKLERFKDDDILKYFSIPRVKSIVKD